MFSLKKSQNRNVVIGLLLVAAIVAGCWYFATRSVSGLAHRFVPGQRLVYNLEYLTASTSNFMGLLEEEKAGGEKRQGLTNTTHTNVEGELVATVLETTKDGAVVAIQLRKATVQIVTDGELAIVQGEVIASELQQPLFAEIDAQGRVVKVRFASDVQPLAQAFARSLVAATQVVLPSDLDAASWQTREDDPNGKYLASYTRMAGVGGDVMQIEKRRQSYFPTPRKNLAHTGDAKANVKPAGQVTIEFDTGDGVVKSLVADEQSTFTVEGKVVARSETTLRMKLQSRETIDQAERKSLNAKLGRVGPAQALSTPGDTSKREAAMHRATLGADTLDSLMTDLAKRQAGLEPATDDTPLYMKLKALIALQPEVCVQLGNEMAVAKTDGPALGMLSGALSTVGHAQAQAALQTAIRARPNDWPAMMMLVPALGMVETPTLASEQTLRTLGDNADDELVRSTAQLSLGIMARTLATTEPTRSRAILQETLKKLDDASSVEARRQNLLVLGNIGAEEALPVIKAHLRHEAPQVRSAATAALRWLEDESIDELLVNALADADEQVRLEAAQALTFRPMTGSVLAATKSVLAKDTSAAVRMALLRNVAQAQGAFSEARGILNDVARNDAIADVREEANRLLAEIGR